MGESVASRSLSLSRFFINRTVPDLLCANFGGGNPNFFFLYETGKLVSRDLLKMKQTTNGLVVCTLVPAASSLRIESTTVGIVEKNVSQMAKKKDS